MSVTIGVITPFVDGDYFGPLVIGMQHVAQQRGANLLVYRGVPSDLQSSHLATQHVTGWIAAARITGIRAVAPQGTPVVVIAAHRLDPRMVEVYPDNLTGMHDAVTHLISHGHRRIGFLGDPRNDEVRQRLEGYRAALTAAGLPVDPDLEVMVSSNQEEGGRDGVRRLLRGGQECTAFVTATDDLALGAMDVLAEAGTRVPDDIAIASFDDIDRARYAHPPLTTVRQHPRSLGELAAHCLLDQIAGLPVVEVALVPTTLMIRESCGCVPGSRDHMVKVPSTIAPLSWREGLALQLVQLVKFPLPVDPTGDPTTLWPDVMLLVDGLAAAIDGSTPPAPYMLQRAWQGAVAQTQSIEILQSMVEKMEQIASILVPNLPEPTLRVRDWLHEMHRMMAYARLAHEATRGRFLESVVEHTSALTLELLGAEPGVAQSLGWLRHTPVTYAALALWATEDQSALAIVSHYGSIEVPHRAQALSAPAFPPAELLTSATPTAAYGTILLMPVRSAHRDWGILLLRTTLDNARVVGNVLLWSLLLATALERDALLESLHEQQRTMQAAYERERALTLTVRQLGSPVLPILPGVLLVPLIGMIDEQRSRQVIEAVLAAVSSQRATVVVLDITSVPVVDMLVAHALIEMARTTRLLGAQVLLVGTRPEIAESIVSLGVDLTQLMTYPSLASALAILSRKPL